MSGGANSVPKPGKLTVYVLPMAVFLGLLALNGLLKKLGDAFWLKSAEYWLYPLQTLVCAGILIWFWQEYDFRRPKRVWFATAVALLVLAIWIAPQAFFAVAPRLDGFNPDTFGSQPSVYWGTVAMRFVRLVIIVPLVEEIFWRGFLLRYLINDSFERVPIGSFRSLSFGVVTLAFTFSHSSPDWIAAFIAGALYNCVAYYTKSLSSCVLAHAITNGLLGIWIMRTGQWGFW